MSEAQGDDGLFQRIIPTARQLLGSCDWLFAGPRNKATSEPTAK